MAAWLVLAKAESKRVGEGYDDNPATHYSWDSTVANCATLAVGDVIALWDSEALLGVSVIETIEKGKGEKDTPYCPYCKKADVAPRKTMAPVYKCWNKPCGAEFDAPGWHHKHVTTYRSRHEAGWTDAHGVLTAQQLRELCVHPKSQLSLRELRSGDFHDALTRGGLPMDIVDNTSGLIAGGHKKATIRVRKGQPAFRKHLLTAYGDMCAFNGPTPVQVLEAAHLYSYAANGKHHKGGGLLLRRDMHRLFDLGLIAVNPANWTLDVSPDLAAYGDYTKLHGQPVTVPLATEHHKWLTKHWDMHRPATQGPATTALSA
ncbi:HNH endonuclease [Streptomyces tubercidicus]|uniref:HNH endonuclease n=1 Tax=Streptomyces tubercidicus TaxID=47759 RepID=UPI002E0DF1C9|nr:HNH endonuclease [Streptomyces tubercidicus]